MKIILTSLIICLLSVSLYAQQTVSTSGGNATGAGGSVSYTVGQAVYTTNTGSNGSVSQGVQQAFEISVVTSVDEGKDISLEFIVYPNPATDYLILKINGDVETQCIASLYNTNGILLQTISVETNETTISMAGLQSGIYILKVTGSIGKASQKELKTFKIIKH